MYGSLPFQEKNNNTEEFISLYIARAAQAPLLPAKFKSKPPFALAAAAAAQAAARPPRRRWRRQTAP